MNIASFTAQIKARKKREEEKIISEQELEETETAELTNNTQSDIPQSYEISVGSDGKVKLKSSDPLTSPTASTEPKKVSSNDEPIPQKTNSSINSAVITE